MLTYRDPIQPSTTARCTLPKSPRIPLRTFCPASSGVRPEARAVTHSPSLVERSSSAVSAMFPFGALAYDHVIFLFALISCQPSLTPTYPQLMRLNGEEQANARAVFSLWAKSIVVPL